MDKATDAQAKTIDEAAGQAVAFYRSIRKWSQAQLADEVRALGLQIAQQTIAKIEAGSRPLKLSEAAVFADALGVAVGSLLDFADVVDTSRLSIEMKTEEVNAARELVEEAIARFAKATVAGASLVVRAAEEARAEAVRLGEVESVDERAWQTLKAAVEDAIRFEWDLAHQLELEGVSAIFDKWERTKVWEMFGGDGDPTS